MEQKDGQKRIKERLTFPQSSLVSREASESPTVGSSPTPPLRTSAVAYKFSGTDGKPTRVGKPQTSSWGFFLVRDRLEGYYPGNRALATTFPVTA